MVIAESVAAAKDGAEHVVIDYEPLPCVTFTVDAAEPDAPRVRDENSSNVCIDAQVGEAEPTEAAFRQGRAYRQGQNLDSARRRFADGAARRDRRLRSGHRPLHDPHLQRLDAAAAARSVDRSQRARAECPSRHPRCRRQFRHARRDLCRTAAGRLGGAPYRSSGEVDQRAQRASAERLSRPRSCRRSGAGARQGRQFPGDARLQCRQSRLAYRQFLDGPEGRRDHVEHLPDAGGAFSRARRAESHRADAALSQLRTSRSHLRAWSG